MITNNSKTVLIGGGSGFIGSALTQRLRRAGWRVLILSRSRSRGDLTWEDLEANGLPLCDVVVNLAGKHILDPRRRWTEAYIEEVIASRVNTTRALLNAINDSVQPPELFISTSGKCFYGTSESCQFYEEAGAGDDFPGRLCRLWETTASGIDTSRTRHVHIRTAIVLGPVKGTLTNGGILPILRLPFLIGLGSKFGSGQQYFPWVHVDDVTGLMTYAIENHAMHGAYNAVSPHIVRNEEFMRAFARALRRPVLFRIPSLVVRTLVGKDRMPILIEGQHAVPKRTLAAGYQFRFPHLETAVADLTNFDTGGYLQGYNH